MGDHVTAYDPATGTASTQTVKQTFINHDSNLLAVTLRTVTPAALPRGTTGSATKQQDAALAAHGAQAPPSTASATTHDETIQTTTNHPWLTADHGWILASFLRVGEPVQRVDGGTAIVVSVRTEPGAAAMWDLTVSNVHTFAVGSGAYVVHNSDCGMLKPGPYADESIPARGPGRDFTDAERQQIDEIGQRTGCHSCGSTNPGRSGHFVPDHQPSNKLVQLLGNGEPQRLYPHCVTCSLRQGGQVNVFLRMLRNFMV